MGEALKRRLKSAKVGDPEKEAMLNLFVTYGVLRQKYDQVCYKYKITLPQYNVLKILKGVYPDGHPRCEIISRMLEPSPDVTRIIDKLEQQRFAERFNSNNDRRLSISRITQKGLNLLEKMNEEISVIDKHLKTILTGEEIEKLSEICEKIYSIKE